jgi:hypothetical protein
MTAIKYRYATFCNITGEVYAGGKHYWLCGRHGEVTVVPYYGFAAAMVYWACPQCIEEHLGGKLVDAKGARVCALCATNVGLVDCDLCGLPICVNHRNRTICDKCLDSVDGMGTGYFCG